MSLYLKYRPSDFNNLVWQEFVKNTLKKSIADNKIVWAYLFCGPRWTWKTSSARIFAKAINCLNPKDWNPCLECDICKDFSEEKLVDIIEIDAASHTWVDNIREIIEKAQFSPTKTKYKVYIIDEVHMLSKWAFNALLKILEEPPKHVKFVLATTETHKVPETIISRCQRYDFKRISDIDIKNRLEYISKKENIKTDSESINYIIKNASGGLRNAISLYEQLISDSELNYSKIVEKLEIVDENIIESFLNNLLNKDNLVIDQLEKLISDWKNIKLFFKELLFYTKNKSLEKIKSWDDIISYIKILDVLDEAYSKSKNSLDENTTFTIAILKILSWYSQEINSNIKQNPKSIKKEVKQENKTIEVKKEIEEELNHEDINDVFWWFDSENIVKSNKEENSSNWGFDKESFFTKLKENWAKSANINTLKSASSLIMDWTTLKINITNAFLKNTIDKSEIITLFIKSLEDIWIENPSIEIH